MGHMNHFIRAVWIVVVACAGFALSGFAVAGQIGLSEFSKIIPGKTTKQEVVAILGAPSRAGRLRTEERETWEYKYGSGRSFWVEFGSDGIVALTNVTVDMNSSRYGGP
jgi:hypothetical protein